MNVKQPDSHAAFDTCSIAAAAAKLLQSCLTLCDPIDSSPTRLPRPWDSQGKSTGVGRHFLLQQTVLLWIFVWSLCVDASSFLSAFC